MPSAPSSVLLLGWNETPRAGALAAPALRPLIQALAPLTQLSVMLPRTPSTPFAVPASTRITALASLTLEEVTAQRPHPEQRPGAWQQPTAPYVGSTETPTLAAVPAEAWTAPAAPYLGATPATANSTAYLTQPATASLAPAAASTVQTADFDDAEISAPTQELATEASSLASGLLEMTEHELLLNQDVHASTSSEPDAAEASALSQPQDNLSADAEAQPVVPAQRATLPEALAALGAELPSTADLNFQVIQYARFATRRALLEDFAVIYASDWPTWLAALELRQQTGRPLVLHVHTLAQERATPADRSWALELERLTLRRADLVLAATEEVAELLRTRYFFTASRLRVVSATDTDTLNATLRELGDRTGR
ncbi:glycosyltransferase family 4 protein [Hymenobacter tenuis]